MLFALDKIKRVAIFCSSCKAEIGRAGALSTPITCALCGKLVIDKDSPEDLLMRSVCQVLYMMHQQRESRLFVEFDPNDAT